MTAVQLGTPCVVSCKEGVTAPPNPFVAESLYAPLLARAIELCREKHLPADMAQDFVQETYMRYSAVGDSGRSREQTYHWLRTTLRNLIEDVRRRRESVSRLWPSWADESIDDYGEVGSQ